jgi:hypothetical protein
MIPCVLATVVGTVAVVVAGKVAVDHGAISTFFAQIQKSAVFAIQIVFNLAIGMASASVPLEI